MGQDYVVYYIHPETRQIIDPNQISGPVEGAEPVWASQLMPTVGGLSMPSYGQTAGDVLSAYLQYGP